MRIFDRIKTHIWLSMAIMAIATMAYAQSPWQRAIRAPENVGGLNARVVALEARNAVLTAALLDLYYEKQLNLLTDRKWAASQAAGWGPFVRDLAEVNGTRWMLGSEYIDRLDTDDIPAVESHILNLEP